MPKKKAILYRFMLVCVLVSFGWIFALPEARADFNFKQGTFTKNSGTGNQSVTIGFEAKAVIFYWVNNDSGLGDDINAGFGFIDDGTNQRAIGFGSIDNKGSSSISPVKIQSRNNCIVITDAASGSVVAQAQFALYAVTGFTVDWTVNDGNSQTMMAQPMFFSPLHTPQNWQIASKRRENRNVHRTEKCQSAVFLFSQSHSEFDN